MRRVAAGAMILLVGMPALWAMENGKDEPKEDAKSKITLEVEAIVTAHQKAVSDLYQTREQRLKNAKTDQERALIFADTSFSSDETISKLWDLVEKNPKDIEAAVTALRWLLIIDPYGDKDQRGAAKAWDLLIKDYAVHPKMASLLGDLVSLDRMPYATLKMEELLRAILEKNPARDAKGNACYYLAIHQSGVASMVRRIKELPDEAKLMEGFLGWRAVMKLKEADPDRLAKDAESVYEEASSKYGDVVMYTDARTQKKTTIADRVASELFELRHLGLGKEVPDIVAEDLDGKTFKLSEYRGKVVVLDFWGHW